MYEVRVRQAPPLSKEEVVDLTGRKRRALEAEINDLKDQRATLQTADRERTLAEKVAMLRLQKLPGEVASALGLQPSDCSPMTVAPPKGKIFDLADDGLTALYVIGGFYRLTIQPFTGDVFLSNPFGEDGDPMFEETYSLDSDQTSLTIAQGEWVGAFAKDNPVPTPEPTLV